MARDDKSTVIEFIFKSRWDQENEKLSTALVTLNDVQEAIIECNRVDNKKRSTANPANFFKDYPRRRTAANKKWPKFIREAGYTAEQRTGEGQCFEFVPLSPGDEPFPNLGNWKQAERIAVQSLQMPLISKSLGRSDEAWLTQVAVKLNFIESYFALSHTTTDIVEIDHLQMNAKLGVSEIDSVYRYIEKSNPQLRYGLILLEAKGHSDDVNPEQLVSSLKAGFSLLRESIDYLLPMALKVVEKSQVHVIEFNAVHQNDVQATESLEIKHEAVIDVRPPVPGL